MARIEQVHIYIITAIAALVVLPAILILRGTKYLYGRCRGLVYDSGSDEWKTKEEHELEIRRQKIKNREIPLVVANHTPTHKNDKFLFFEKRKLRIPYDQLVYVESEYSEEIHHFFADNAEWLETWQRWHGWDIAEYDVEDIKEGMFYPQDYSVFRHGFLWCSPTNSWDEESGVYGNIHYYYELNPTSDKSLKDQMESMMRKIYDVIDLA